MKRGVSKRTTSFIGSHDVAVIHNGVPHFSEIEVEDHLDLETRPLTLARSMKATVNLMPEEAVRLICETGVVALAHSWALKNPVVIIRRLKEAGLHGLDVYRSDDKLVVTRQTHIIF